MWPFSIFQYKNLGNASNAGKVHASLAQVLETPLAAQISYNPNLIAKLKRDNQELIAIHTLIHEAVASSRFTLAADNLIVFQRVFRSHVLVENVQFYFYLEKLLKNHAEEKSYVHSLRKDMNVFVNEVSIFCDKWITHPVTALTQNAFIAELQDIGVALTSRIELEESTLYTFYVESL
jgi:hypothetical protein